MSNKAINFEIVLKLIRLANNNPNEHEANLAARRVCILLKDWKPIEEVPKQSPTGRTYSAYDYVRYKSYEKVKTTRKCFTCGKDKETFFTGPMFVCQTCQWEAFNKKYYPYGDNPYQTYTSAEHSKMYSNICKKCKTPYPVINEKDIIKDFTCAKCQIR